MSTSNVNKSYAEKFESPYFTFLRVFLLSATPDVLVTFLVTGTKYSTPTTFLLESVTVARVHSA